MPTKAETVMFVKIKIEFSPKYYLFFVANKLILLNCVSFSSATDDLEELRMWLHHYGIFVAVLVFCLHDNSLLAPLQPQTFGNRLQSETF